MDTGRDWKKPTGPWRPADSPAPEVPAHMLGRVLHPDELRSRARYDFAWPAAPLRPWVERYWSVHWDLEPGQSLRTATLTEPALNLTYEFGQAERAGRTGPGFWLTGPVKRRRFDVTLLGSGGVLGIKFQVGAGPAFGITSPGALIGTTGEAVAWFPDIARQWLGLGLMAGTWAATASQAKPGLDDWLAQRVPAPDPGYDRFRMVLTMLDDPEVTRLEQVAKGAGCSVRTLERLFGAYAGIGPKWLLTRARVIDAVAALDAHAAGAKASDAPESLADLAMRLGWFDQAHFTTDFRRIVGVSPQRYRARDPVG